MARVLITGVTGQIGSYTAEQLIQSGHEVFGVSLPMDAPFPKGVMRCRTQLHAETAAALVKECAPLDAIVHLAGVSSVAQSWQDPLLTLTTNTQLTASLVHEVRDGSAHLVHASSAEIFGRATEPTQNELTPIAPLSPYGISKAAAHMMLRLYRDTHGARASNAIFFLAESERRAPHFVFRKITRGLAAIRLGRADHLSLGDTSVVRDFCHARDFAAALAKIALDAPSNDYVCASGEGHSIADIATTSCELLGLDPRAVLRTDPALLRPNEIPHLVGDSSRLRALGWAPSLDFRQLVKHILDHDLNELSAGATKPL